MYTQVGLGLFFFFFILSWMKDLSNQPDDKNGEKWSYFNGLGSTVDP